MNLLPLPTPLRSILPALILLCLLGLLAPPQNAFSGPFAFETGTIRYALDAAGQSVRLEDKRTGKNWLGDSPSPFAHVRTAGKTWPVTRLERDGDTFLAQFGKSGVVARYRILSHDTHLTVELADVQGAEPEHIDLFRLRTAPFPRTGNVLVVQWNEDITLCLMALGERVHSHVEGRNTLAATVYPEFGMVGEKVALIAVPTAAFLDAVQAIEKTYGLPSPTIGGVWAKQSPDVDTNYLFVDLSEETADRVIAWARRGGFQYVLIPWRSWAESTGSYPINTKNFPKGEESLKATIEKFHAAGLKVGMHMMTSLVSKNDPLVRPIPDPRLLKDARSVLSRDIGPKEGLVPLVDDVKAFSGVGFQEQENGFNVAFDLQIDDEIVSCRKGGADAPNVFSMCSRGARGTVKTPHKAGTPVYHLAQGAGAYVADLKTSLKDAIAERIAGVINGCGFDMIYFDGGELNKANGPHWYYVGQQQTAIWKRLKRDVLFQGSGMTHWLWHIASRATCDDHAALAVKAYMDHHKVRRLFNYQDNFIPAELGWCGLLAGGPDHPATTVGDIEHYGVRMIAHDVPISIQTRLKTLEANPDSAAILERLKKIDAHRHSQTIPPHRREALKTGNWSLFDASGALAIHPLEPETPRPQREITQATAEAGNGRVLFQGNMRLTPDPPGKPSPLPGTLLCTIFCRDQAATATDCFGPPAAAEIEAPVTPQDLGGQPAIAATIRVSGPKKNASAPHPVLNIQLEDARGWYRDHYVDLDFTGEKTILIPRTHVERLLPEFGRPEYNIKRAMRYFDNSKVAAINLRWMRKPKNTGTTISLKKIWTLSPRTIPDSAPQKAQQLKNN